MEQAKQNTLAQPTLIRQPSGLLWVFWVLSAVLTGTLTMVAVAGVYNATGDLIWSFIIPPFMVGIVGGVTQAILLRFYLANLGLGEWTITTFLGVVFGWFASLPIVVMLPGMLLTLFEPSPPLWIETVIRTLGTGVVGAVVGLAQWQVLRHYVDTHTVTIKQKPKRSSVWIISSGIAWILGEIARIIVLRYSNGYFATPTANQASSAEGWVVAVSVIGLVTGIVLVWLLRNEHYK